MKIAVIGAGFTGLTAAYQLAKKGHTITVYEKDATPGGLAIGYKEKGWGWTLEKHYHHWFTNDKFVLDLASEIGHKVLIKRPKTSVYVDEEIFQFDSPKEVLLFPKLSLFERLRMAAVVGMLRYDPLWKPLEKINASTFLPKAMGEKAYKMIWEPQFVNKFGKFASDVSLAWFWARLAKRTPSLAYPEGGFLYFIIIRQLRSSFYKKKHWKCKNNFIKFLKSYFAFAFFNLQIYFFLGFDFNKFCIKNNFTAFFFYSTN